MSLLYNNNFKVLNYICPMISFISVKEYAEIEKISVQAVYQRIAKGTVKFQKIGSVFLVQKGS